MFAPDVPKANLGHLARAPATGDSAGMGIFTRIDGLIERLPFSPRFFRFCVVGTSGVGVNLLVATIAWIFLPFSLGDARHGLASALAIVASIFTNFLLNDAWTWRDRDRSTSWWGRLGRFYLVSLLAALVQWGVSLAVYFLMGALVGLGALYLGQVLGIGAAMALNFVLNHRWTFKPR